MEAIESQYKQQAYKLETKHRKTLEEIAKQRKEANQQEVKASLEIDARWRKASTALNDAVAYFLFF